MISTVFAFEASSLSSEDGAASVIEEACLVPRISINHAVFSVDSSSTWDSENGGFYYPLFLELWLYDGTSRSFQFHDLFVGIWLNDIDIIHAHSSYAIFGAIVGLGALGQSVGKVLSLDSSGRVWKGVELYSLLRRFGLKISKSDAVIKLSSRMLDAIIVPSLNLRKSLINLGVPPEKVKFIPPSVDISKFNPSVKSDEVKAELGIDVSDKVVLFAGDLSPWKGAEIFLKAIRDVKKTVRNFKSILLTKGIYEFEERRRKEILGLIEELGLNGNVIILGRRNDIPSVYTASNIVVLPYVGDFALMDIPRSLLEALASGKPIVASEIGGITEVIGRDIGLLVSAGEVEWLTEAIITLLLDEKLVRLKGLNGRRLIERYYNWDVNIRRIYEVYREYAK